MAEATVAACANGTNPRNADAANGAVILISTSPGVQGAFNDRRVILQLATPADQSLCTLGQDWSTLVRYDQHEDGPVHLVIGPQASDEALRRAAARLGVNPGELRRFRAPRP